VRFLRIVLVILSALLLAAHFYRRGAEIVAAVCAVLPLVLLVPGAWARRSLQIALGLGAVEWLRTLWSLARVREAMGEPWVRMAVILGSVAVVTAVAALLAGRPGRRPREDS